MKSPRTRKSLAKIVETSFTELYELRPIYNLMIYLHGRLESGHVVGIESAYQEWWIRLLEKS